MPELPKQNNKTVIRRLNPEQIKEKRQSDSIESSPSIRKEYFASEKRLLINNKKDNSEVFDIKLASPYKKMVPAGEGVLVAEFDFINWGDSKKGHFDDVVFFEKKIGEVAKGAIFKYIVDWDIVELVANSDPSIPEAIRRRLSKTKKIPKWETAVPFTELSELPHKNVRVGMFTDTSKGENVEWVPVFGDLPVYEWAEYEVTELDTRTHEAGGGEMSVCKVDDTHFIAAFEDSDGDGRIATFSVDGSYNISFINEIEHDANGAIENSLIQIDSTHYMLAYSTSTFTGYVKTFSLDGSYNITEVDSLNHDAVPNVLYNSLILLDSTHAVLAYGDTARDGRLKTFSLDGSFNITEVDDLEHDTSDCWNNSLCKIDDTHFMLAYTGVGFDGFLKTFSVDGSYNITEIDSLEHDTANGRDNALLQMDSTHYALAYTGNGFDGWTKTFSIDGSYNITEIDSYEFETSDGRLSSIAKIDDSHYIVAYKDDNDDGAIKTFAVDGSWVISEVDHIVHDTTSVSDKNSLVHLTGGNYVLGYTSFGDATLTTFSVELPPDGLSTNQRDAEVHGFDTGNDSRSAEVDGGNGATSDRNAEIDGEAGPTQALSYLIRRNDGETDALAESTNFDSTWDTEVASAGDGISYSAGTFTLAAGKYLIMYSERWDTSDTTNNTRLEIQGRVMVDGVESEIGAGQCYIRKSSGQQEGIVNGSGVFSFASETDIDIRFYRTDGSTTVDPVRVVDWGGVQIIKLADDWDYGRYSLASNTAANTNEVTWATVAFDTDDEQDTGFSNSSGVVTLTDAGKYLVSFSLPISHTSGSGRTEYIARLNINGSEYEGTRVSTYMRGNESTQDGVLTFVGVVDVGAGETISVENLKSEGTNSTFGAGGNFQIVELPSGAKTFRRTATSGNNNPSTVTEFSWDVTEFEDTDTFTIASATDSVTEVDTDGDYLFFASLNNNSSGTRAYPTMRFSVNDTIQEYGSAGEYGRNSGTAGKPGYSTGVLLPGLSAGDDISVEVQALAATTTMAVTHGSFSGVRLDSLFPSSGNSSRSAEIDGQTGSADADDARDAEVHGQVSVGDNRDSEIHGRDQSSSDRDSEIHGQDSSVDSRDAETHGQDASASERDAEIIGSSSTTNNRDAEIQGKEGSTDSRDLEVHGQDSVGETRDSEISGELDTTDNRSAEIHGQDSITDSRSAETTGSVSVADSRSAEVEGSLGSNAARGVEIHGEDSTGETRSAEIDGSFSANDNRDAEVTGIDFDVDSRDSEIHGQADASSQRGAETHGSLETTSNRDAEIQGQQGANSDRSGEIRGSLTTTDAINSEIHGQLSTTDEKSAEISGQDSLSDTRSAEINGAMEANASRDVEISGGLSVGNARDAEITGTLSAVSSRGAEISGGGINPYCSTDSPYSPQTSPYSAKTSPFTAKSPVYTGKVSPYEEYQERDCS